MMGSPSEAPAPTDANEWRKSWMRSPCSPAAAAIAAQGFFRSLLGASALLPQMTKELPSTRGRLSRIATAAGGR